jgi:NACHT domain
MGRARCSEGTRTDVLQQIYRWINLEDSELQEGVLFSKHPGDARVADASTENSRIFWINGSAGTGKTTIAYTIAEACRIRGILGASFFCSRDDAGCSKPGLIFTTIAHQLGLFCPPFDAEVRRTLQSNPDIGYSDVPYQLEELIVKPLRAVGDLFPPCLIVLDALDECKDTDAISIILSSLSRFVNVLSPLKVLVTSRPERNIAQAFKSSQLNSATQRLILHEIELDVVQNDIEYYLASKLALIRESNALECSWPSQEDVHTLARLSFGLFIFAATSIKFIDDRNHSNPKGQLANLIRNTVAISESSSPHRHLDQLYTQVLIHAFPDISPGLAGRLKTVLGSIIVLQDPLASIALEQLLRLEANTVRQRLIHLHSLLIVPEDDTQAIRLLHPSFFDFVTDPTRCRISKFVVTPKTQHTLLARACLDTMKDLRRDICDLKDPSLLNSEIDGLSERVTRHIPSHLRYACRHWAFHLTYAMVSDVLLELLKEFFSKYLLYWVEACSLLGDLRVAIVALDAAQQALAVCHLLFGEWIKLIRLNRK